MGDRVADSGRVGDRPRLDVLSSRSPCARRWRWALPRSPTAQRRQPWIPPRSSHPPRVVAARVAQERSPRRPCSALVFSREESFERRATATSCLRSSSRTPRNQARRQARRTRQRSPHRSSRCRMQARLRLLCLRQSSHRRAPAPCARTAPRSPKTDEHDGRATTLANAARALRPPDCRNIAHTSSPRPAAGGQRPRTLMAQLERAAPRVAHPSQQGRPSNRQGSPTSAEANQIALGRRDADAYVQRRAHGLVVR